MGQFNLLDCISSKDFFLEAFYDVFYNMESFIRDRTGLACVACVWRVCCLCCLRMTCVLPVYDVCVACAACVWRVCCLCMTCVLPVLPVYDVCFACLACVWLVCCLCMTCVLPVLPAYDVCVACVWLGCCLCMMCRTLLDFHFVILSCECPKDSCPNDYPNHLQDPVRSQDLPRSLRDLECHSGQSGKKPIARFFRFQDLCQETKPCLSTS